MPAKGSGSGIHTHAKGYLRISRRGPWRNWLVHRKVMLEACQEFCYYPVDGNLPPGMTVEHLDHNRQHNCRENLMLLDKRIHDAISIAHAYNMASIQANRWDVPGGVPGGVPDDVPDWVAEDA